MRESAATPGPGADSAERSPRCELIAIASSAGGLPALIEILGALPASVHVPMVIVQHRAATNPEILPQILARAAHGRRVKSAENGELLAPDTVYVAPAEFHLMIDPDRTLRLADGRRIKYLRSSANPLLESAAHALEGRIIAVVLTGSGSDGTDGVQTVKSMGGLVIAQDPNQALYPGMPGAAIRSGAVDYVLPLNEIAPMLAKLAKA